MTEEGIKGYLKDRHLGDDEQIEKLQFGVGNKYVSTHRIGRALVTRGYLTSITDSSSVFVTMSSSSRIHLSSVRSSRLAPRE